MRHANISNIEGSRPQAAYFSYLLLQLFSVRSSISSDVIEAGSAETKAKTETNCTEAATKTAMPETEASRVDREYVV